ncbi:NHLP leader peptide family RiPP precursor [Phaeodactylibacter sp.]|uniref:NHLP leader peptide family RiPP precursor n=1 Tax=Phaeodactylibacter sp. TaxID=1940289 RepID=UPI0025E092FD|nr:NHLP leader peptide family RiPP precursor [Phaeodactylibacter sp.]MCI4651028.1 NHLP leader peptide family RiPP precursor [Phaeodactylibacter sp.]MCI5093166.1 NHLP leader peptide family RiPP precursor [Phaeodactylibacter sp.]
MKSEQKVLYEVLQKAWKDPEFRKRLIQSPVEEIERLTGARIVLPEGKTLEVYDQTDASKVYLNLPVMPDMGEMELSDEQLEGIVGGAIISLMPDELQRFATCIRP